MIRRNTWILLLLFAAALLGAILFNRNKAASPADEGATPPPESLVLFSPEEGAPTSIRVAAAGGGTTELAHNQAGEWVLVAPVAAQADQGLAEAAASQIATLRILDEVSLEPDLLGLARPSYVVTVKFSAGGVHKLEIGDLTPSQSGYYVRLDGQSMLIVGATGLDALLNLATVPPYAASPVPTIGVPGATATP